MYKRKTIIINKKFQLRTALIIIGVAYLFVSIVIIAIIGNAMINNNKLITVIENQKKALQTQKNIFLAIDLFTKEKNWNTLHLSKRNIANDIKINMNIIDENISLVNILTRNNRLLLITIICVIILQGLVLYYLIIKITHRISGPIYHISQYIKDITEFRYPSIRPLRANDEFKELHELVVNMANALKKAKKIK